MIPRHRPPFGIAELTISLLPGSGPRSVEQLEQAYADALNVPHAIWLPSARYGICHALKIGLSAEDRVYCSAFTCKVVHQAILRSSRKMIFVDSDSNGPLMDRRFLQHSGMTECLSQQVSGADGNRNTTDYGAVLSEVFGYRYLAPEELPFLRDARLRIFDMAMCIPTVEDMQRLTHRDVAVISFGLGKSLYAGWGGMAFTKDRQMADSLRNKRSQDLRSGPTAVEMRQTATVWLRTLAHTSWLYKLCRRAVESHSSVPARRDTIQMAQLEQPPAEWCRAPTAFHLKLAGENLKRSASYCRDRIEYSNIYRAELSQVVHAAANKDAGWLTLLPENYDAMSHFCIRVRRSVRDSLRNHLWLNGFDTAVLFPFPEDADSEVLQNTHLLTQQILGLPLFSSLGSHRIRRLCSMIREFGARHPVMPNEPIEQQHQNCMSAAA